jgi:Raf kinase inhibitor-like YbhB/YbcL family protein
MYDPDAPSGSGFWHWAVADIPPSVTELPTGAGDVTGEHLPAGAVQLPNDARWACFIGAGPPPGDGRHRYVIVVQALGIEKVGQLQLRVQADSTPAWLGFSINLSGHLLGRAVITPGRDPGRMTLRAETSPGPVVPDTCPIGGQTRVLTVTHETSAIAMTCISAGLAGHSRSLPSWSCGSDYRRPLQQIPGGQGWFPCQ